MGVSPSSLHIPIINDTQSVVNSILPNLGKRGRNEFAQAIDQPREAQHEDRHTSVDNPLLNICQRFHWVSLSNTPSGVRSTVLRFGG